MDNVYDLAHALARAMKDSQQMRRYREAAEKISDDERSTDLLARYREKQMEYQNKQFFGEELDEDEREDLAHLRQVLETKPAVRDFLRAEIQLVQMMSDVQEILSEAVDLDDMEMPPRETEGASPSRVEDQ